MEGKLYEKMAAVMGEVGYIKKRGRNQVQNYDYVMASDIAGEMAKLFSKHGIAFFPEQQTLEWETRESAKGNALFVCKASIVYTLADIETGQLINIPSFGEGIDNGDKAAYKAMTGALKYALIQTFLIAAGDDPEDETESKELKPPEGVVKVAEQPACVLCGAVGTVIKGRPEYGGGWICFAKKGGCGAKYRDDQWPPPQRVAGRSDNPDPHNGVVADPPNQVVAEVASDQQGHRQAGTEGDINAGRATIDLEQVKRLDDLCKEFGVSPSTVIRQYQMSDKAVRALSDLTLGQYQHALGVFDKKRERQSQLN